MQCYIFNHKCCTFWIQVPAAMAIWMRTQNSMVCNSSPLASASCHGPDGQHPESDPQDFTLDIPAIRQSAFCEVRWNGIEEVGRWIFQYFDENLKATRWMRRQKVGVHKVTNYRRWSGAGLTAVPEGRGTVLYRLLWSILVSLESREEVFFFSFFCKFSLNLQHDVMPR